MTPLLLVRGAPATYDASAPAQATSRRIEDELAAAGVSLLDREDGTF
jgi:hypothetical protein